jgi:hypothetical protein
MFPRCLLAGKTTAVVSSSYAAGFEKFPDGEVDGK